MSELKTCRMARVLTFIVVVKCFLVMVQIFPFLLPLLQALSKHSVAFSDRDCDNVLVNNKVE